MIKQEINCQKIQKNIEAFHFKIFGVKYGQLISQGDKKCD